MEQIKPIEVVRQVVVSPENALIKQDYKAIWKQSLLFLTPMIAMYLTPVIAVITEAVASKTFVLTLAYFVPSPIVIGGMILYVLNRIWDTINRFVGTPSYKV